MCRGAGWKKKPSKTEVNNDLFCSDVKAHETHNFWALKNEEKEKKRARFNKYPTKTSFRRHVISYGLNEMINWSLL